MESTHDWYFLLPLTWTWVLFSLRYTCQLFSMTAGFNLSPNFKYNDAAFFWEIPCFLMTKLLEVRSQSYLWFVLFRILWIFLLHCNCSKNYMMKGFSYSWPADCFIKVRLPKGISHVKIIPSNYSIFYTMLPVVPLKLRSHTVIPREIIGCLKYTTLICYDF